MRLRNNGAARTTSESKQSVSNAESAEPAEPAEPKITNSSAWSITPPKLAERALQTGRNCFPNFLPPQGGSPVTNESVTGEATMWAVLAVQVFNQYFISNTFDGRSSSLPTPLFARMAF
jgi:hypothetical protein